MDYISNEVRSLRSNPLPDSIVNQLIKTVEQAGFTKGCLVCGSNNEILYKGLMINEIRYRNSLLAVDYSYEDILYSLNSRLYKCELSYQLEIFKKSFSHANIKMNEYKVLPAPDLLRIDYGIREQNKEYLNSKKPLIYKDGCSKKLWDIINDLYNPMSQYPSILEGAIALYRLIALKSFYDFDVYTIDILFSLYINNYAAPDACMIYLSKYLIISGLDEKLSFIDAVEKTLNIFYQMFFDIACLAKRIDDEVKKIEAEIKKELPKICSERLLRIIFSDYAIKNTDIEEGLNFSTKTAISYLQQLSNKGFLVAAKAGKERIYINYRLFELIKDGL